MPRMRRIGILLAILLAAGFVPSPAQAATFSPGAPGIGDPYFPLAGNGGYDVASYDLAISYDPDTDVLQGTATIRAGATQNLSSFDLDLDGLAVAAVSVDGRPATFNQRNGELVITPGRGLNRGSEFTTVVRYGGVPQTAPDGSGFIHTSDGALIVGQPRVAATWFPVNDHPADKATFTFRVTVPQGLQVVANGLPGGHSTADGATTWVWRENAPMAPYLATASIGRWHFDTSQADGLTIIDAIDQSLLRPTAVPHTGGGFAISQVANSAYKRLTRVVRGGQTVTFWVNRQTEPAYDFFFVEARTPGGTDWTTLPDANGHSSRDTGGSCPGWQGLHPWLTHYQSPSCAPRGTSGEWNAASGTSDGWESWALDLSDYPADVELSFASVSDEGVQGAGVFLDDVRTQIGPGSTSFEQGTAGWAAASPPPGSPVLENDWIAGTTADAPPPVGERARDAFAREPEILSFLSSVFGPYPFSSSGGIVDERTNLAISLENQTRPIYRTDSFEDPESAADLMAHELSHQWYGDSVSLERWSDIWLNEGFASYAEWLWAEHEGLTTGQEIFDMFYARPAGSLYWKLTIGDPGPKHLFDQPVYERGAMTLYELRQRIGDDAFLRLLPAWSAKGRGGNVTTEEFIDLAEQISGQQLDDLFDAWLYTSGKPEV